jgi:hypothetical protein
MQDLQYWHDRANEAVPIVESNAEILKSLRKFYFELVVRNDFSHSLRSACESDLEIFFSQLDEVIGDFDSQIARVKLLVSIINDREELVQEHLHAQTEELNKNIARETVVMRIVTIVTLLYLPATFVSVSRSICFANTTNQYQTFFSIDVVKYQPQDSNSMDPDGERFSALALARWLQVTLPLTALTLFGAWYAFRVYDPSAKELNVTARMRTAIHRVDPLRVRMPRQSRRHFSCIMHLGANAPFFNSIEIRSQFLTMAVEEGYRAAGTCQQPIESHWMITR